MALKSLIVGILGMAAAGGAFYALFDKDVKNKELVLKRVKSMSKSSRVRSLETENQNRRKQVSDHLKALEAGKAVSLTLNERLAQAGLEIDKKGYLIGCCVVGLVGLVLGLFLFGNFFFAVCFAAVLGVGFPQWLVGHLIAKRFRKFEEDFPSSLDVIVRGVKAGLPFSECIKIISQESEEPIRGEIRQLIEAQGMGISLSEAIDRMAKNIPIQEVKFFSIVIAIQQKTGGSLADSLSNLSRILRDRKRMRQKILSMSSEAKSSAMIIGSMPIVVALLLTVTAPEYVSLLWTTSTGQVALVISGIWMAIGIFVMKQIINFDV